MGNLFSFTQQKHTMTFYLSNLFKNFTWNWNKWHMAENTINEIRMKLKTINNQQNLGNQKHKTLTHDM